MINGHSYNEHTGIASHGGGLLFGDVPDSTVAIIRKRLKKDAPLILLTCEPAAYNPEGLQKLANRLQRPVIANTGKVDSGNHGKGNWVIFKPEPPEAGQAR